jgi:oxalate decarboxylase
VGGPDVQSVFQYTFRVKAMAPTKTTKGGEVRVVDAHNFPASKNIASAW